MGEPMRLVQSQPRWLQKTYGYAASVVGLSRLPSACAGLNSDGTGGDGGWRYSGVGQSQSSRPPRSGLSMTVSG